LLAHLLATALSWVRIQISLKIQNGRHKQMSGQHTLARQKSIERQITLQKSLQIIATNNPRTTMGQEPFSKQVPMVSILQRPPWKSLKTSSSHALWPHPRSSRQQEGKWLSVNKSCVEYYSTVPKRLERGGPCCLFKLR
jgi:hypothetical protein